MEDCVIDKYYSSWHAGDFNQMETCLDKDFTFKGPMEQHVSPKSFMASCRKMAAEKMFDGMSIEEKTRVASDEQAVSIYDCVMAGGKRIPMAEYFEINNGKIKSIHLFFDSRLLG